MRKVVQCILLKTMAALAVLEDIANGAIGRERVFRDREDLLAHDDNWLISRFKGNPPGTVSRAVAGVGATVRNHALLVPTGDVHTGVPSNWGIPEGAGQPVDPVPSHASRVGRNYLHLSRYIKFPQCS